MENVNNWGKQMHTEIKIANLKAWNYALIKDLKTLQDKINFLDFWN